MQMPERIPLLVIAGPTASGKSGAAIELALMLNGEVVSADSMQVYKYMDIGTAKVDKDTRAAVPHYMLDVVEPDQDFTLADYKEQAQARCKGIWSRGKLPILAGGTGLYIKAICDNFPLEQLLHDQECRDELKQIWDAKGQDYMAQWLQRVDPETAARVADQRRIIRALEVYELTGKAPSLIQREAKENSPFKPMLFALTLPRPKLYENIDARAEQMVIQGIVGEYISLINQGYPPDCNAMMGLGYRHCGMHIKGLWTLEGMLDHLKRDTRRYAKRQLTWLRGMQGMEFLDNTDPGATGQRIYEQVAGKIG
jgi:tRNA dimethylallyltransferase